MKSASIRYLSIPLFAFSLAIVLPSSAHAESKAPVAAEAQKIKKIDRPEAGKDGENREDGEKAGKRRGYHGPLLDEEELGKVEKMSPDERDAYFKEKHERFKNMSPEEREALKAKRKAWFESLTPEQKEKLKERRMKMGEEFRARMKQKLEAMTPEEREKFKEKMKQRGKERWESLTPEQKEKIKAKRGENLKNMPRDERKKLLKLDEDSATE